MSDEARSNEAGDSGDERDLTDDDLRWDERLFIPLAARMPSETIEIPLPLGRDQEVELAVRVPQFVYADARIGRLVNERVASFARALTTADAPAVTCSGLATAELVSIQCSRERVSARSAFDLVAVGYAAKTWRIEDGALRAMAFADAFVPGADLPAILARGCRQFAERTEARETELDCRESADLPARAAFGVEGVNVGTDDLATELTLPSSFVVTYDDMAEHLLATGPLAASLYRRRATTREVSIDPARRTPGPRTRRVWAIGVMASPAESAMRWLAIPAAQREAVQLVDGYLVAPAHELAQSLASALGLVARQVEVPADARAMTLRAQQTTRETPLRVDARRAAPVARILPRGTIVVTTGEPREGHARAFASADADGYVDVRALGPADACLPDFAPVLAAVPESARADAVVATLRVITQQLGGTRAVFATELGSTIHVELRRVDDSCVAETLITRFDRPGARLTYFGLSHTERSAGRALVVTTAEGEGISLTVHAYDGGESLYRGVLREGQRVTGGRSEGEMWYPVVILDADGERVDALRWTGEALVRAASP